MGISLPTEIIQSDKTPRTAIAFDKTSGNKQVPDTAREVLLVGQFTADGTATANTPYVLTREDDGATLFGSGSILDVACRAAFLANPFVKMSAVGITDAGTPSSATVTFADAAEISTTGHVVVAGKIYDFDVTVGDTANTIGQACADIVVADDACPVTADNVSGVVTCTANCGGTITNGITLDCYFDAPVNLVGTSITLSGSNFTGGSGVVDITNTLAATTGHRYHVIAILLDDSASGGLAKSHTDSEGDAEHNHGEIYIQCCNGTLSANTTIALAQNANRGVLASINGSPSWTVQIAAAMAAVDSREEVATRPRNGTVLTGIVPPPVSYRWSRTETRNLLDNGCSPLVVLPGEQVAILREVTTGVTNGNGDFDYSTLDVTKILGFDRFRDAITLMMDTNYQKARWADSDPDGLLPTDVATPEKVTIDLIDVARDMEAEGIVSNVETLKDQFVVEKHGTQCWFSVPALIVDGMHEKLGKVVYITKLPLGS